MKVNIIGKGALSEHKTEAELNYLFYLSFFLNASAFEGETFLQTTCSLWIFHTFVLSKSEDETTR